MLTRKEKAAIRNHYQHYGKQLRVHADESVTMGGGILYFPEDTQRHLEAIGLRPHIALLDTLKYGAPQ